VCDRIFARNFHYRRALGTAIRAQYHRELPIGLWLRPHRDGLAAEPFEAAFRVARAAADRSVNETVDEKVAKCRPAVLVIPERAGVRVAEIELGAWRGLYIDPIQSAADGGALGIEAIVAFAIEDRVIKAEGLSNTAQAEINYATGGESLMEQG